MKKNLTYREQRDANKVSTIDYWLIAFVVVLAIVYGGAYLDALSNL